MNDFQSEQLSAFSQVRTTLGILAPEKLAELVAQTAGYLRFRRRLDAFVALHFGTYCTQACYQNQRSACCSKDGIIIFWADVVINTLHSRAECLEAIERAIERPAFPGKCIFLARSGCVWKIRPLLCTMFLCDGVHETVIQSDRTLERQWALFQCEAKSFRWPDRPVLFDHLERQFMDLGCRSTLMHLHTSPGLLRVKRLAGLIPQADRA